MDVKSGRLNYAREVAPILEAVMDEVEQLVTESNLPEAVDVAYWDDFICKTLEASRFKAC
jgi:hypothetical protein